MYVRWVLWIAITFGAAMPARAEPPSLLTEESLYNFLLRVRPSLSDADGFFRELEQKPKLRKAVLNIIKNSKRFQEAAEQGNDYRWRFKTDFSVEFPEGRPATPFAIDPFGALAGAYDAFQRSQKNRTEVPLPWNIVARNAKADVYERMGIPVNVPEREAIQKGSDEGLLYKKRLNYWENQTETRYAKSPEPPRDALVAWKRQMADLIDEVRIDNLKQATRIAMDIEGVLSLVPYHTSDDTGHITLDGKSSERITPDDLVMLQFRLEDGKKPSQRVSKTVQWKPFDRLIEKYMKRLDWLPSIIYRVVDSIAVSLNKLPEAQIPALHFAKELREDEAPEVVFLSRKAGGSAASKEAAKNFGNKGSMQLGSSLDYLSKLIRAVDSYERGADEILDGRIPERKSYLIECWARERELSALKDFLRANDEERNRDFANRMAKRPQLEEKEQRALREQRHDRDKPVHKLRLPIGGWDLPENDLLAGIEWAGRRKHPYYWDSRDDGAREAKAPSFRSAFHHPEKIPSGFSETVENLRDHWFRKTPGWMRPGLSWAAFLSPIVVATAVFYVNYALPARQVPVVFAEDLKKSTPKADSKPVPAVILDRNASDGKDPHAPKGPKEAGAIRIVIEKSGPPAPSEKAGPEVVAPAPVEIKIPAPQGPKGNQITKGVSNSNKGSDAAPPAVLPPPPELPRGNQIGKSVSNSNKGGGPEGGEGAEGEKKDMPYYRLVPLRGSTVDGLPQFYLSPLTYHGAKERDLEVLLNLEKPNDRGRFAIRTEAPHFPNQNGDIPLLRVDYFDISRMELKQVDAYGKEEVVDPAQYKVVRDKTSGMTFVRLNESIRGNPVGYRIQGEYGTATKSLENRRSPLFNDLSFQKLTRVNNQLKQAGFKELAGKIDEMMARNRRNDQRITLGDIEQVFRTFGFYTYTKENGAEGADSKNPFSPFTKFISPVDGKTYWQCDGSNGCLTAFLKEYFKGDPNIDVEVSFTLARKADETQLTEDSGHARTAIQTKDGRYRWIIDATPRNKDARPKPDAAQKAQREAERLAAEKAKAEAERIAKEKAEKERLEKERQAELERQEKVRKEKAEQARIAQEKLEKEKIEQEKVEREKVEKEKLEKEKLAAEAAKKAAEKKHSKERRSQWPYGSLGLFDLLPLPHEMERVKPVDVPPEKGEGPPDLDEHALRLARLKELKAKLLDNYFFRALPRGLRRKGLPSEPALRAVVPFAAYSQGLITLPQFVRKLDTLFPGNGADKIQTQQELADVLQNIRAKYLDRMEKMKDRVARGESRQYAAMGNDALLHPIQELFNFYADTNWTPYQKPKAATASAVVPTGTEEIAKAACANSLESITKSRARARPTLPPN